MTKTIQNLRILFDKAAPHLKMDIFSIQRDQDKNKKRYDGELPTPLIVPEYLLDPYVISILSAMHWPPFSHHNDQIFYYQSDGLRYHYPAGL